MKGAREILDLELARLRKTSYPELAALVDREPTTRRVAGNDGTELQVQTQVFWDGAPQGPVRVLVAVDDGGIRAFKPITDDFIVAPDGRFLGEDSG